MKPPAGARFYTLVTAWVRIFPLAQVFGDKAALLLISVAQVVCQIAKDDMPNKPTALLAALLITTAVHGGEIYKWKDKDGKTHFGNSPFQAKTQNREKVKLNGTNITAEQRKETDEIAEKNKRQAADKPVVSPGVASAVSAVNIQASQTISPSQKKRSECQEAWRKFKESQECFGKYALDGGGMNGVAFQYCTELREPAEFCDYSIDCNQHCAGSLTAIV